MIKTNGIQTLQIPKMKPTRRKFYDQYLVFLKSILIQANTFFQRGTEQHNLYITKQIFGRPKPNFRRFQKWKNKQNKTKQKQKRPQLF